VKVPALSHTADTILYMYYGNAGASDQRNSVDVWSNGYVGVWHFASGAEDSTGVNNGSLGTVGLAAGAIGKSASLSGSNYVRVPTSSSLEPTAALTMEGWIKPTTNNSCMGLFEG